MLRGVLVSWYQLADGQEFRYFQIVKRKPPQQQVDDA